MTASALQGTLPHPADFVDAAMCIGTLRGLHGLKNAAKLVPKLREIYARIGKLPEEVAEAARTGRCLVRRRTRACAGYEIFGLCQER